jgi:alkylresorcinol/alkylpyrone synthase
LTFIRSIGTAVPEKSFTQRECWEALQRAKRPELTPRTRAVLQGILNHDNGIERRSLALDRLDDCFNIDPDTLYSRFVAHAPVLASRAAHRALERAGLDARQVDGLVISTCTGYLCPGLSGYVVERLGLRADVQAFDLVGQGCAAALPNLQLGQSLIGAGAATHVLSVCVEVSSAAMYLDNDPGVLISACLFGDGAGAAVLSARPGEGGRSVEWQDSASLIEPGQRKALMFEQKDGMLRNILTREVPTLAADYAHRVLATVLDRNKLDTVQVAAWIMHAGGRDVLLALERRFELDGDAFRYSAAMLREYGNLSSAFVYFVLEAALADGAPPGWWWLSSFGAGFSCHGALLRVQ